MFFPIELNYQSSKKIYIGMTHQYAERYSITYFDPPPGQWDSQLESGFVCTVDLLREDGDPSKKTVVHLRSHRTVGEHNYRREEVKRVGSGEVLLELFICNMDTPESFDAIWDFVRGPKPRTPAFPMPYLVREVTNNRGVGSEAGLASPLVAGDSKQVRRGRGSRRTRAKNGNGGWQEVAVDWAN